MSFTFAAFVTDAVGSAYIVLLIGWLCKVRVDGDPIGPLQALSRTSGRDVLWIVGGGLVFAAAIGCRAVLAQESRSGSEASSRA